MDTLNAMERIEVDNKDRPIEDIVIEAAQVFVDPFTEAEEQVLYYIDVKIVRVDRYSHLFTFR